MPAFIGDTPLAPRRSFFPQQRLKRAAQQRAEGGGDSLPVAGLAVLESAEALHEIKGGAVNLNRIHRRPAMEPLAPTASVVRPSPLGCLTSDHPLRRFSIAAA